MLHHNGSALNLFCPFTSAWVSVWGCMMRMHEYHSVCACARVGVKTYRDRRGSQLCGLVGWFEKILCRNPWEENKTKPPRFPSGKSELGNHLWGFGGLGSTWPAMGLHCGDFRLVWTEHHRYHGEGKCDWVLRDLQHPFLSFSLVLVVWVV
jgi:hypothetical protein